MKRIAPIGLLLLAALLIVPAPAQAASCSASDVTVVVQFPDAHTQTGCAGGDPDTGYAALKKAFGDSFITYEPDGAVCKLGGEPAGVACHGLGTTYWAYFHAKPGGSWSYSNVGGGSWNPEPGSVEGWRFGGGAAPTTKPPGASTPTKAPTKSPTKKPTKEPSKDPTASVTSTPAAPDATASTSSRTDPSSSATATDSIGGTAEPGRQPMPVFSSTPTVAPQAGQPTKLTNPDDSSSGGISWIWGLVLLGVLAAGGGAAAVVRRRS